MALGTVLLTGWVENAVSVQGWRWAWPRPGETLRSVSGATGGHALPAPPATKRCQIVTLGRPASRTTLLARQLPTGHGRPVHIAMECQECP